MDSTVRRVGAMVAGAALVALGGGAAWAGEGYSAGYVAEGHGFPDWGGQWHRIGAMDWPPEGYREYGAPPLTDEYREIYAEYTALQQSGIPAGDPTALCLPAGMPRMMKMPFPMELVVTPNVTFVIAEAQRQLRRIYTDGRDWPDYIIPSFQGYSIGEWLDTSGDGEYDTLSVETRGFKGPRSYDAVGVPLHENNQSVVRERISLSGEDPDRLENRITTYDDALTEPWTITLPYRRDTGDIMWAEYVCAEDQRHIKLGEEWYFVNDAGELVPTRAGQPRLVPERRNDDG